MAINHTVRTKDNKTRKVKLTGLTAIRLHCIECMGFQIHEVKRCTSVLCPLYPFRMGKYGKGTE
jgi:hypothetical protein